jgi:putative FmdB family regulatory protein
MPLYEYECFVCKNRFERIRRVADASGVDCPECGGKVRRLLGVPALQFKGSGWYVNDYGKGNGSGATADETEKAKTAAESSTDSTPKESTEKKTAKKADAKVA